MAAGGASGRVAKMSRLAAKEVLRDVRVGPERRVEGTRVEQALGTVCTARTCGERPAGLPLGGGRGGVGVAQDRQDRVLPLGWGGGHSRGSRV